MRRRENMDKKICLDLSDGEKLQSIGKALSSQKRIELLELLGYKSFNINEIAEQMNIPPSSAAMHVKVLEEAGLITTELMPGIRGSMKLCKRTAGQLNISLKMPEEGDNKAVVISMPIGHYVDYQVYPTCGLAGAEGFLDAEDEPRCFYNPKRTLAQLLWFGNGFVEYRFPNAGVIEEALERIELSMELCSEAADYNMDYPSDITVWINGIEAGTWTCPGDFGGRRGKLNPEWWPDKNTQYGVLKTWVVDKKGTKLDEVYVSGNKIKDYQLVKEDYISVRIGIGENAGCIGGVNLFGEGFGDYRQNILLKLCY